MFFFFKKQVRVRKSQPKWDPKKLIPSSGSLHPPKIESSTQENSCYVVVSLSKISIARHTNAIDMITRATERYSDGIVTMKPLRLMEKCFFESECKQFFDHAHCMIRHYLSKSTFYFPFTSKSVHSTHSNFQRFGALDISTRNVSI